MTENILTPKEKRDFGGYVAARLRKLDARLEPTLAQKLEQRDTPISACLRQRGKRVRELWFTGGNQLEALEKGIVNLREQLSEHSSGHISLELCMTHEFRVLNSSDDQQWRRANFGTARGVLGVELSYQGLIERFSPTHVVATNRSLERLLQLFAEKHEIEPEHVRGSVRISQFQADQLLVLLEDEPRTIPLVRGMRLVAPEEVTQEQTRTLADELGGFLANHVHDDGRMTYLYYPSRASEEENPSLNNMIRQWMATLALSKFARAKDDRALSELVDKNIRFNLEHYYRRRAGLGLIEFRGYIKLGAVALAALSLMEHERRDDYSEIEASLLRTIDQQWLESGAFRTFVLPTDRDDNHNFYPGEALLAWAHRIREKREPELIERFMRSFRYYRSWHLNPKHRNPAFIPWHTQAYHIVFLVTNDAELRDFIFEMNDWLVPFQQWPTPEHPEFAGRFYDPDKPYGPPHASSTGVYMEGLIDAFELARTLGDDVRAARYARTISRGIRSLMQLTFRDEADLFYSVAPDELVGGVRTTCYNNVIRIDNVQHNLLALLKILPRFAAKDYATDLPGEAAAPARSDQPGL